MTDRGALILDSGTGYIKIGHATDTFPTSTYPALVGRPILRTSTKYKDIDIQPIMVGHEAAKARQFLDLNYPMSSGIISNWEDQNHVWKYGFDLLKVQPEKSRILVTEPVNNPTKIREEICQNIFETHNFDKFQIQIQALLSAFGEGCMSTTVLDSGDGVTHVIPILNGYVMTPLIKRINLAGRYITEHLSKLLFLRGYAFNTSADFETVREIKERCCFVSHDVEVDRKLSQETTAYEMEYTLPDGSLINIGRERFEASEVLFNPQIAGLEMDGMASLVFNAIREGDATARGDLFKHILLSGGTTMFPGFSTRMKVEMDNYYRSYLKKNADEELNIDIQILDSPNRKYNVFFGGCLFANSNLDVNNLWITKKIYEEKGAARVMREEGMCFSKR